MQIGRASKWFRGLLGLKKPVSSSNQNQNENQDPKPYKKKWSFAKGNKEKDREKSEIGEFRGGDERKHEVRVALTARPMPAVREEFRTAAGVTRRRGSHGVREEWAAVTIQSRFRAYLARKALRALKSLVKLQALVRGHILRQRTADILRGMQALARAQARARAERQLLSESHHSYTKPSHFNLNHIGPATPEKSEHVIRASRSTRCELIAMSKRNGSTSSSRERSCEQGGSLARVTSMDDERSDKILEVDTSNYNHFNPKLRASASEKHHQSLSTSNISGARKTTTLLSPSSSEAQSLSPLNFVRKPEESPFCTAENSPQYYSAPSMGGTSSSNSKNGYSEYPNYMACTESYKAKARYISVPKQKHLYLRSSSMNRNSVHANNKKVSALSAKFTGNAYPGSGRLDGIGMPTQDLASWTE